MNDSSRFMDLRPHTAESAPRMNERSTADEGARWERNPNLGLRDAASESKGSAR
jgi:hypothetical protein